MSYERLRRSLLVSRKGSEAIEAPRIQVTLATNIPEERCRLVNLGYADYREIDPREWEGREQQGMLLVPHAGEILYRAPDLVLAVSYKIEALTVLKIG